MPVVFSAEALTDLVEIRAYIGDHNPAAASRIAVQIAAACDALSICPNAADQALSPALARSR